MVVFDPVKLIITNYDGKDEMLHAENNPEDADGGSRDIPFSSELWIEREDFMEVPPKKWFRLAPGQMVRLKSAYIIKCDRFEKDAEGKVTNIYCSYIPESRSGHDTSGVSVKGTLHWVSARHAVAVELRLYDRLFKVEDPTDESGDFKDYLNPDSLTILSNAFAEPAIAKANSSEKFQFVRKGYFVMDPDSSNNRLVFNRTVELKESWKPAGTK
jgi:glutaminyl-tRNA synthetase